jgi:hypothetical protein
MSAPIALELMNLLPKPPKPSINHKSHPSPEGCVAALSVLSSNYFA